MSHEQPSSAEARPSVRSERYQGEFEDDERHGHGTCVFADGGKYTGAWRTGTIEGKGRYEHANGDVFEGEFSNRRRVRGRLQLADGGDEYDGEFDGELPHGEGKRTYAATGAVYAGQWAGGEPTGTGEWRHPSSGEVRRGSFVNGVLHGDGEETDGAGRDSYVGQFERGVRHGRGRVRRSDGSSWDGEWEAGEARGECALLEEPDGSGGVATYSGGWAHGTRHGKGKQTAADGSSYDGEWHRGDREGVGKEELTSGETYEGEWLADRRHGKGTLTRPGGYAFVGDFEVGTQRGAGVVTLADGGTAEADAFVGETLQADCVTATRRWPNGDSYVGPLKGAHAGGRYLPHGRGTITFADGATLVAEWTDGRADQPGSDGGEAEIRRPDGGRYVGGVVDGKPHGAGRSYGPLDLTGRCEVYEGEWANGHRDGEGKLTRADGSTAEGTWAAGVLDGTAVERGTGGAVYRGSFVGGVRDGRG